MHLGPRAMQHLSGGCTAHLGALEVSWGDPQPPSEKHLE